jgi:hypothetical protein
MPPVGFELTTSEGERPQTYTLTARPLGAAFPLVYWSKMFADLFYFLNYHIRSPLYSLSTSPLQLYKPKNIRLRIMRPFIMPFSPSPFVASSLLVSKYFLRCFLFIFHPWIHSVCVGPLMCEIKFHIHTIKRANLPLFILTLPFRYKMRRKKIPSCN